MHSDWRNFLQQQGAIFNAGSVANFGNPVAELRAADTGAVLADLSHEGLITATGSDARLFLQGQLSTDMLALTPALSQFSSWSSAKGRIVTLLRLFEYNDAIYVSLPQTLTASVLKRLSMHVLRAQVKLADAGDNMARFGLAGKTAPDLLAASGFSAPRETNAILVKDGVCIIRLHGNTPRFAVHAKPEKLAPLWKSLTGKGVQPAGTDTWTLLRIQTGEPVVHPETSEHFVAQMLGLEKLGAINFKKGCYTGQEVIARAHYRGAVKRHLRRAHCATAILILPGAPIHTRGTEQAVAEVVDACGDASAIWQMLIVLQDEFAGAALQINDSIVTLTT
ncbi:MAG: folate-binding protein [Gammaproteobacteria bacterium]